MNPLTSYTRHRLPKPRDWSWDDVGVGLVCVVGSAVMILAMAYGG